MPHSPRSRIPQKLVYHEGAFLLFSRRRPCVRMCRIVLLPAWPSTDTHGVEIDVFVGDYWVMIHTCLRGDIIYVFILYLVTSIGLLILFLFILGICAVTWDCSLFDQSNDCMSARYVTSLPWRRAHSLSWNWRIAFSSEAQNVEADTRYHECKCGFECFRYVCLILSEGKPGLTVMRRHLYTRLWLCIS